jgi:hypothetical protein
MQIDRSNYEIWLIDWLDGKLTEVQIRELQYFLKENPDLDEEFEDFGLFRLRPLNSEFLLKKNLIKIPAELTDSQFDYLCAAYIENDLSSEQQTELKEIILSDPAKNKSFELIRKMKLVPPAASYNGKSRLTKRTLAFKIIRLSVIGLSAAAVFAAGLFLFNPKPAGITGLEKTDRIVKNDNPIVNEAIRGTSTVSEKKKSSSSSNQINKQVYATSTNSSSALSESEIKEHIPKNDPEKILVKTINTARISHKIDLKAKTLPNSLIELKSSNFTAAYDDGRSKFSKIIAKTFREKILKEQAPRDKPLKAYEIAEASVSGLNKILGWEMALDEKRSDDGKTEKIYFNSRILKFNAPVKKSGQ